MSVRHRNSRKSSEQCEVSCSPDLHNTHRSSENCINSYICAFLGPRVAAVFASLNDDSSAGETSSAQPTQFKDKINIDEIISNAKTVNGLLSIAETKAELSRNHALKVRITLLVISQHSKFISHF